MKLLELFKKDGGEIKIENTEQFRETFPEIAEELVNEAVEALHKEISALKPAEFKKRFPSLKGFIIISNNYRNDWRYRLANIETH